MDSPTLKKKAVLISQLRRILLVAGLILAVLFLMNLNNRITILYQKKAQRDDMRVELYQLRETNEQLQTQIAYATSVVAVEEWARTNRHWVMDGDIPVFPMSDGSQATVVPEEEIEIKKTPANWEVWYELFFGE